MTEATFGEAIRLATGNLLRLDSRVHVLGLGASYPNGADGTLSGLAKKFPNRIHDTPCSEAAVTGAAVGMAVTGLKPIIHHGRIEFSLFAMDALITQAAKWNFMFGGNYPCPLTVRIAMGRQWGNGPQHTLTNKSMFAVPGLQVVCPASARMAGGLLQSAHAQNNPVIFLESRWLYKLRGNYDENFFPELGKAYTVGHRVANPDIVLIGIADTVVTCQQAAERLKAMGVIVEVIDLVSVYPLDAAYVRSRLEQAAYGGIVVEAAPPSYSVAFELRSHVDGDYPLALITCPDYPCPTAPTQTASYYPTWVTVYNTVAGIMRTLAYTTEDLTFADLHLPPTDFVP